MRLEFPEIVLCWKRRSRFGANRLMAFRKSYCQIHRSLDWHANRFRIVWIRPVSAQRIKLKTARFPVEMAEIDLRFVGIDSVLICPDKLVTFIPTKLTDNAALNKCVIRSIKGS
jgi:hypothetical protein